MRVTDRALERTGFQEASPYGASYDLRTDFVMAYGVGQGMAQRMRQWSEAGYVVHAMTGVAWGAYQDYLDGKTDGRAHWDEGQVDAKGDPILHGPKVPYMVPTVSFSDYLEKEIRRLIDAGVNAIHLEEPEFWARAGYSEAFKREWEIFYGEPWRRPDSSCDAQYRSGKLKQYLYRRALDRLCASMKEYALVSRSRAVRFYVPTHSLLNYTQWGIVSPESALIELPSIDGVIAQVWTGTARTPNVYQGRLAERTFETAYLEYGIMRELVRSTGRRVWFLHDPIEDNPGFDWEDYRKNYLCTLVASLLHPDVCDYEVSPWPRRVFLGKYPTGQTDAQPIPADYATMLQVCFNHLRDMRQEAVSWDNCTDGVGIFLADSAMFQRPEPAWTEGTVPDPKDPSFATPQEVRDLSGFFGLALPPLKAGIPIRPVQLDNAARFPGYLDPYRVLLLSYEFMKPANPGIHLALAQWVARGGSLIYVGADTDPFHQIDEWWNKPPRDYATPTHHLLETLGVSRRATRGEYRFGKGLVILERKHPSYFSRSSANAKRLMHLLKRGVEAAGLDFVERNAFLLRRGPYVIAAVLDEATSSDHLELRGLFIDLLDPHLSIEEAISLGPGRQAWLIDLDAVEEDAPAILACAGRIEEWEPQTKSLRYVVSCAEGIDVRTRILLPAPPGQVSVAGTPHGDFSWHDRSQTVLLRHPGNPKGTEVYLAW